MDRTEFEDYIKKFNSRDYDGVMDFYHDELEMAFFGVKLTSRQEMKDFYAILHDAITEKIIIQDYIADNRMVAIEAIVRIEGKRDLTPEEIKAKGLGQLHPIKKGQVMELEQFIHYRLKDGKFTGVRCALVVI